MRHHRSQSSTGIFTLAARVLLATVLAGATAELVAGVWLMNIREKAPNARLSTSEGGTGGTGYRTNGKKQDLTVPGLKVVVFGGATTQGMGVADVETIPAYLEEALRGAGKDVQVFNFAAADHKSSDEREAFARMLGDGLRPDVAVFVDGLAEYTTCAPAAPPATTRSLTAELAERSHILQLARGARPAEPCRPVADVDKAITRMDVDRRMIDAVGERMGVKVVFVQQPIPAAESHIAARNAYSHLAEKKTAGVLWQSNLLWLAEMEAPDGNGTVDSVHYSPAFNRAIADAIARHVVDGALLP